MLTWNAGKEEMMRAWFLYCKPCANTCEPAECVTPLGTAYVYFGPYFVIDGGGCLCSQEEN